MLNSNDFPITYDPCVCSYSSILNVGGTLISNGSISFSIKQNTIGGTYVNSGTVVPNTSWFKTTIGTIDNISKKGNEYYKSLNEALTAIKNITENNYKPVEKSPTFIGPIAPTTTSTSYTLPSWTKEIPEIGYVVSLVEYLISGGKEGTKTESSITIPDLVANGNLLFSNDFGGGRFLTPGADQGNQLNSMIPIYNNPLGIFNLVKTPELEYIDYYPNLEVRPSISGQGVLHLPKIRQYKVKDDLSYIVNPSSGLELVDIQACLIFKLGGTLDVPLTGKIPYNLFQDKYGPYGPVLLGNNYNSNNFNSIENYGNFIDNLGLEIERYDVANPFNLNGITFRTKYLPIGCFNQTSFSCYIFDEFDPINVPEIFCKVKVILKRLDNPNAKEILYINTFNVNKESSLNNTLEHHNIYNLHTTEGNVKLDLIFPETQFIDDYFVHSIAHDYTMGWSLQNLFTDFQTDLIFENTTINSGTYNAWNTITLGNNTILNTTNGPIIFRAGKAININPEITLNPNILLQIGFPIDCDRSVSQISNNDLQSFCGNYVTNKYTPNYNFVMEQDKGNKKTKKIFNVIVSPNPAINTLKIKIQTDVLGIGEIIIKDLYGKNISKYNFNQKVELMNHEIDTKSYISGFYFITVKMSDNESTQKIMIIH